MKYKVTFKDGRVYRASKVEVVMGFIIMQLWDGELRLPSGEVAEISKPNEELWVGFFKSVALLFLVVFLVGLVFFSE